MDRKTNRNQKEWKWLKGIESNLFKSDSFSGSLNCFSVFADSKGILVILSEDVVSLKLSVTGDYNEPLQLEEIARIRGLHGSSAIRDNINSFLLSKDGNIYAFKSFKKIYELPGHTNVKLFECFKSTCYILICQKDEFVKLKMYNSFGNEFDIALSEFDLSCPANPVTVNNSRSLDEFCVVMIEGPLTADDIKFFNELLACDLEKESIHDVLLISIDDKLLWIRYQESFTKRASDFDIDRVTSTKGIIKGMNYSNGALKILDDRSILTTFYLCPTTNLITKKEILLEGKVRCFRFHEDAFIYSNLSKVIFIDSSNPQKPNTRSIDLKRIVALSVVDNLNFIIAICCNRMFYYIPMNHAIHHHQSKKSKDEFDEFQDADIEAIPRVAKFLEVQDKKMLELEKTIKEVQKLKTLLQHLNSCRDFKAGEAIIEFHRNYPSVPHDAIVCRVANQKLGSGYIELKIKFPKILASTSFKIIFDRHFASGVVTRLLKIDDAKDKITIVMPAEPNDNPANKMELDLNFSYDVNGKTEILMYPISIINVIPFDGSRVQPRDDLDECLEIINKMKM